MTGSLSLAVTFLPLARLTVPAGTMKSGRLPFMRRFQVRHLDRHRRADKQRLGQFGFQRHLVLRQRSGGGEQNGDGQSGNHLVHLNMRLYSVSGVQSSIKLPFLRA